MDSSKANCDRARGAAGAIRLAAFALAFFLGAVTAQAADKSKANFRPYGIFCSCPPTTLSGSRSVLASVAAQPFVSGFLVRAEWRDLEPQPGQYQWSLLDEQLATAQRYGKQVALAVLNGPMAPSWLTDSGARVLRYSFRGRSAAMPVPWDTVYLAAWERFIDALGKHYRDHPALTLVHVTHSTFNGFEMQLPTSPADRAEWQRIGYRSEKIVDSWKVVLTAFARAFPRHPIDVEVHPVVINDNDRPDTVAGAVATYGRSTVGKRFGIFAGWWSLDNATRVYPEMFTLLTQATKDGYAGLQMVASHRRTPERIGGGMRESIDFALTRDIGYVEIWETDLLDPDQRHFWESLAQRLR